MLVVAMAGVLLFVTAGLAAAGGLVTAQRRAQGAADLAALGAAATLAGSSAADPCAAAARVAGAHGAALERCGLAGPTVTVTVAVAGPDVPWQEVRVTADARAGPG
ncbi:hypothetical protein H7342_05515 [Nocardioides sp. zg-1228]|nr:hypothetical protein [Nocardioides sp. zg-1228]QSF57971.1 hypothetical protein JX575_01695 [Nocardioides sp. zg-1228]